MTEDFVIEIEYDTREDVGAHLADVFADHHPHPHRTPEGRAEVFVRVAAEGFPAALRAAADLAARPAPAPVLGVHVLTADELDRRHPSPPERYGVHSEGR